MSLVHLLVTINSSLINVLKISHYIIWLWLMHLRQCLTYMIKKYMIKKYMIKLSYLMFNGG